MLSLGQCRGKKAQSGSTKEASEADENITHFDSISET